ncbi:hypothetical protein [Pseudomonas baltica]|uniref:Uncharacterized protein n=1 Tax=Pseudomonas baltica TaxID=2762576 RepID=A0A7X1KRR4_9PSED|nr:hypothetical protein [Pseudomonas baltica]MBC2676873.1 hypothetical protein [Pseudomonas baltica]
MPKISVITTVATVFEVPEGLTIEQVRNHALQGLSEMDELTDSIVAHQDSSVNQAYLGDAVSLALSVENVIAEGIAHPTNPAQ